MQRKGRLARAAVAAMSIAAILAGCDAVAMPTARPTPTPVPTAWAHEAQLRTALDALTAATGTIDGKLTMGFDSGTLTGTVSFSGADSKVSSKVETGSLEWSADEVRSGGERFARRNGGIWIDEGEADTATAVKQVLTGSALRDDGVATVEGVSLHRILVEGDLAGVPGLFATDVVPGIADLKGSLRIWTDENWTPKGFGTSLTWSLPDLVSKKGERRQVSLEADVLFGAGADKVKIAAPEGAWQRITDDDKFITFAIPPTWGKRPTAGFGAITFGPSPEDMYVAYILEDATGKDLNKVIDEVESRFTQAGFAPKRTYAMLGGVQAGLLEFYRPGKDDYMRELVSYRNGRGVILLFVGAPDDDRAQGLFKAIVETFQYRK